MAKRGRTGARAGSGANPTEQEAEFGVVSFDCRLNLKVVQCELRLEVAEGFAWCPVARAFVIRER